LRPDQNRLAGAFRPYGRYNRLLRIEQELGTQAKYAGRAALKGLG
jgi:enolase